MRIGIFAKTFAGSDPATVFSAARAAGYGCVQYNMACSGLPSLPDAIAPETADAVAAAARAHGITIAAVSATYNMIHPDPAVRADGLARLAVIAEAAPRLGTRLVTLCSGTRDPDDQWRWHPDNDSPAAWADLLAEMAKAAAIAERFDVDLGIEPELANVVNSPAAARRLLDAIGSPRLKIVLDPANLFEIAAADERRRLVAEAVALLGPAIAMAHAKDRTPDGAFTAAGTGVIDFHHLAACLADAGFDGALVTHGLDAAEAPAVAAFLHGLSGAA